MAVPFFQLWCHTSLQVSELPWSSRLALLQSVTLPFLACGQDAQK